MKILYMSISYLPEKNGLYQNLVDTLVNREHEITIVRSKANVSKTEYDKINSKLRILTVKTADPFSSNLIKKGINQISLASMFKKAINEYLSNDQYDLILYATPPITLASVVRYCKKKYHAKTFLMLKDIFPQNAVDLGMMRKNSIVYKYFRRQEKRYYEYSDFIGCMSQGNKDYLLRHNSEIRCEKVGIFPNSITISEIEGLSFHEDKTVFMFGGNLGKPQGIDFLLKVIEKLKDYSKAEFWIIGEGTEKNKILEFVNREKCSNLKYTNYLPQQEYEKMLKCADVGMISLDARFTIPNIPSRFQTYLKLKKPVLAITDVHTDLRNMIEDNNCGWWCPSSDEKRAVEMIKYICEEKELQKEKGLNGFRYLVDEFNVEDNVEFIEKYFRLKKGV